MLRGVLLTVVRAVPFRVLFFRARRIPSLTMVQTAGTRMKRRNQRDTWQGSSWHAPNPYVLVCACIYRKCARTVLQAKIELTMGTNEMHLRFVRYRS